jgi:benzil reductase ((S)-benzoin forming)
MNILITGTGKGLGSSLALHYLEKGHAVSGISRTRNPNLEKYPEFRFLAQDLSKLDELHDSIPGFIEKAGEPDLVILNAGVMSDVKDLRDCSLEEIREVMDINLWANKIIIDLIITAAPSVKQVAAISSGASVDGKRGWNAYAISKAALNMLIRLYSQEHTGTHFCSIAPGLVDSDMQKYIFSLPDDPRFPSIKRLKEARAGGQMPSPARAAGLLVMALEEALKEKSGSFLDIREMEID